MKCLREVVSDQEIDKQKIIDLQKEFSEVKSDQELCSKKLSDRLYMWDCSIYEMW